MWSVSETYNLSRSSGEGEGASGRQENWGRTLPSGQRDPQTPQWERLGHTRPRKEDLPLECGEQEGRRTGPQRGSRAVGLQHVQATDSGFYLMNTRKQC